MGKYMDDVVLPFVWGEPADKDDSGPGIAKVA
jgi:hypothetical protein